LIPVSYGIKAIGTIVGVSMFDGVLKVFAKGYGVVGVPTIKAITSASQFGSFDYMGTVI
jgi:hypothetical protein